MRRDCDTRATTSAIIPKQVSPWKEPVNTPNFAEPDDRSVVLLNLPSGHELEKLLEKCLEAFPSNRFKHLLRSNQIPLHLEKELKDHKVQVILSDEPSPKILVNDADLIITGGVAGDIISSLMLGTPVLILPQNQNNIFLNMSFHLAFCHRLEGTCVRPDALKAVAMELIGEGKYKFLAKKFLKDLHTPDSDPVSGFYKNDPMDFSVNYWI